MDLLIVAATLPESDLLRERFELTAESMTSTVTSWGSLTLLHTGVGMVNTAFALGAHLANHRPDLAIQVGVAGSFDPQMDLETVVEVEEEIFSELGAESGDQFLGLEELGFPLLEVEEGDTFFNRLPYRLAMFPELPQVRGLTVNTVHGTAASIDRARERWDPQIETMEGGAFFFAMHRAGLPFAQLRGISNRVEPRNRAHWRIVEASQAVQQYLLQSLEKRAADW